MRNLGFKKWTLALLCVFLCASVFLLPKIDFRSVLSGKDLVELQATGFENIQVFHSDEDAPEWNEDSSQTSFDSESDDSYLAVIPGDSRILRIDFNPVSPAVDQTISKLLITSKHASEIITSDQLASRIVSINDMALLSSGTVQITGSDPYLTISISGIYQAGVQGSRTQAILLDVAVKLAMSLLFAVALAGWRDTAGFFKGIIRAYRIILSLAVNDLRKKYASSYFGTLWAFIQPVIMIFTYWFVFQVGFRAGDVQGSPFILWFIAGIIPWFFFSDGLSSGASTLVEYSYLVKKVMFDYQVLPVVRVLSSFFIHFFFLFILLFIHLISGNGISLLWLQILYYELCLLVLLMALCLWVSTLAAFARDITHVVAIALQIGFWFTPIGWVFGNTVTGPVRYLFMLNPMFYIIEGFRGALVYRTWFWEQPLLTIFFWGFTLSFLTLAIKLFQKTKHHFADVL